MVLFTAPTKDPSADNRTMTRATCKMLKCLVPVLALGSFGGLGVPLQALVDVVVAAWLLVALLQALVVGLRSLSQFIGALPDLFAETRRLCLGCRCDMYRPRHATSPQGRAAGRGGAPVALKRRPVAAVDAPHRSPDLTWPRSPSGAREPHPTRGATGPTL